MEKITYASLGSLGEDFHGAFEDALQHLRDKLGGTYPLYIEGKAKRSKAGTFADTTPADTSVLLGKFQRGSRDDARRAVAAAKAVYPVWRDLGWEHRVALLRNEKTPLAKALEFARSLPPAVLREILQNSRLPASTKTYLFKELKHPAH